MRKRRADAQRLHGNHAPNALRSSAAVVKTGYGLPGRRAVAATAAAASATKGSTSAAAGREFARSGGVLVENMERRQRDVGDFLVMESSLHRL